MEATYLELVSNTRALYESNQQLEEALKEDPDDIDFRQAIKENKYIILRKRDQIVRLVVDMKRMGANIDVPDDIRDMKLDLTEPPQEGRTAEMGTITETDTATPADEGEGVYL